MKSLKTLPPPFPEHISEEPRGRMRSELLRLNRGRIVVAVLLVVLVSTTLSIVLASRIGQSGLLLAAVIGGPLGFALMRAIASPAIRRNNRTIWLAHHLCPECGYDMRATPGRCPECGYVVPQPGPHNAAPPS